MRGLKKVLLHTYVVAGRRLLQNTVCPTFSLFLTLRNFGFKVLTLYFKNLRWIISFSIKLTQSLTLVYLMHFRLVQYCTRSIETVIYL